MLVFVGVGCNVTDVAGASISVAVPATATQLPCCHAVWLPWNSSWSISTRQSNVQARGLLLVRQRARVACIATVG